MITGATDTGYGIEIQPEAGTEGGTEVMNLAGPGSYRTWQMQNL